ncbi:MAG: CDP-alcohol phosphatidyltransferase family protein [Candidatus Eisenbacteria bacterium]
MVDAPRPALRDIAAPPNLVTLVRIVLVPAVLVFLAGDHRFWALAAMAVMFVSDGLDGYLARRTGRVTDLGKVLDPAADKIAVAAVLLFLVFTGEFPLWALLLVVARDVAIVLGGVAIARRSGSVPQALMAGKVAVVILALVVIVFVADVRALEPAALVLCVVAVAASGTAYAVVARRALSGAGSPKA